MMQARVSVWAIETYFDKDDHLFYLYVLKNKPLHLTIIFDSRTEHDEFTSKKEFDIDIIPKGGKVKRGDIKCIQNKEYLKETNSEINSMHRYKFMDKVHGISILFDGLHKWDEFVSGKWYHFTIENAKTNQTTILDHVDQEAAGAKS